MYQYTIKPIGDLIPYVNNSRTHDEEQVTQLASSMKEFGFTNPVLIDEQDGLIAGHGRVLAAKRLGLEEIPAIIVDGLTEAQKKALVIADNQLALNADWDIDKLKLEISSLDELDFNLDLLGFKDDFLASMQNLVDFEPATEDEQGQLDELDPQWCTCPHCGKEFDLRENK